MDTRTRDDSLDADVGSAVETPRGRVLVVDDGPAGARVLAMVLNRQGYEVRTVGSGEACLAMMEEFVPEVIFLDIEMPGGIDGYETCRLVRSRFDRADLTIMFLSGHDALEERLQAYDAGGDDFVAKPFDVEEIQRKIDLAVGARIGRQKLVEEKVTLKETADMAMHGYSEMGAVLRFARGALACRTLHSLAEQIISSMRVTESDCHVQLRGSTAAGTLTLTPKGLATPLEESVIEHMISHDRIFQFKSRMILNYGTVSVLVVNMPADEASAGRIRDYGAIIAEAAQDAVANISLRADAVERAQRLRELVADGQSGIEGLQASHRAQQAATRRELQGMVEKIEAMYYRFGLTDSQEEDISATVRAARDEVLGSYGRFESEFDSQRSAILDDLDQASTYQIYMEEVSAPADELWG